MGPFGGVIPLSDRPDACLTLDLSTARERLAVRLCFEEITDGFQARRVIKNWMTFYNTKRPHSALDWQTPDDAYWAGVEEHET